MRHLTFLRASVAAIVVQIVGVGVSTPVALANVNLEFRPAVVETEVGLQVFVELYAVSDDMTNQSIGAMDVILEWDPAVVRLEGLIDDGDYDWLVSGFLDDSGLDGLNDTFLDGDALFTCFSQVAPNPPAFATPIGLKVVTFEFTAVGVGVSSLVMPTLKGDFSVTRVLDGFTPGVVVTGTLSDGSIEVSPALECFTGTVDILSGTIRDVLFLNGSNGGVDREVEVGGGELIWATLLSPPQPFNDKFVMTANAGAPTAVTEVVLPFDVGNFCFPLLLNDGADAVAIWNNIGKEDKVGSSIYFDGSPQPDPDRAPVTFLQLWEGDAVNLPVGTTLTFQGVITDLGSPSRKKASATNAVILSVQ